MICSLLILIMKILCNVLFMLLQSSDSFCLCKDLMCTVTAIFLDDKLKLHACKIKIEIAHLDEPEVKLAAKVVGESPVVVVDAEIGGADFADAQLLLLVRAGRHRVSVLLLGQSFLLANFLNLHHLSYGLSHTRHRNNAKFSLEGRSHLPLP